MKKLSRTRSSVKPSSTRSVRNLKRVTIGHPLGSSLGTLLGDLTHCEIDSIEIPPDLGAVSRTFAILRTDRIKDDLREPAAYFTHRDNGCEAYAEQMLEKYGAKAYELPATMREIIEDAIQSTLRAGFYIAVMRYSEQLKHIPEALAVLNQKRKAAHKGGEVQHKKAAPRHKAICKRFRELEKSIPKLTARYLRIAKEFNMDEGSVGRIVRKYTS